MPIVYPRVIVVGGVGVGHPVGREGEASVIVVGVRDPRGRPPPPTLIPFAHKNVLLVVYPFGTLAAFFWRKPYEPSG